jgi:formate hydrogenlyase subunit 3/multisubunit Na+/H+ antiporter MnhD subunit
MVSAIYILAAALAAAFLLGLLKEGSHAHRLWHHAGGARAFMSYVSVTWLIGLHGWKRVAPVEVFTAGTEPPFAINLRMGLAEAALTTLVNLTGLLSAIYLKEALFKLGHRTMAVLLVAVMALCGVILTRDVFNLFVFFELVVISTAGLVLLSEDDRALAAGFKYLIVSQVISVLLLVGIIFAYHATGTLNIDGMAEATLTLRNGGMIAFFLMFIAVSAELKPFPANGWALDIYESAHPAFSAIFSAATGAAALYAVDKMLLIGGSQWLPMATGIGLLTFIAANLFALAQDQ